MPTFRMPAGDGLSALIRLGKQAIAVLFIRAGGAGFGLVFNLLLTRQIGASGVGVYSLCLTVCTIQATVAKFGLENVMFRRVVAADAHGRWEDGKGALFASLLWTALFSAVLSVAIIGGADRIAVRIFEQDSLARPLQIMCVFGVANAFIGIMAMYFRAVSLMKLSQVLSGLLIPALAIVLFLALEPLDVGGPIRATLAYASASAVTLALAVFLLVRAVSVHPQKPVYGSQRRLLGAGVHVAGIQIADLAVVHFTILLLGAYASVAEVGIFGIANRLASLMTLIFMAINIIAATDYAAMFAQGRFEQLRHSIRTSILLNAVASFSVLAVILVVPELILSVFGEEFRAGANALRLLAVAFSLSCLSGPAATMLLIMENERDALIATLLGVGAGAAVALYLIPDLTGLGAALITLAGFGVRAIGMSVFCQVRFRQHRRRFEAAGG